MHEDHEVSRRARRKDTLSAEDLGILLQWHWKYGTLIFPTERRRCDLRLLKLWSSFTGSRPATLVANDGSALNDSRESSADDLSSNILRDDSDGDTLVGGELVKDSDYQITDGLLRRYRSLPLTKSRQSAAGYF